MLTLCSRAWIMRGFLEGGMRKNYVAREEFFRRAIDVIEWGRSAWKNVSRTERGAIFDETFLRGLRAMHMNALMEVRAFRPFVCHLTLGCLILLQKWTFKFF